MFESHNYSLKLMGSWLIYIGVEWVYLKRIHGQRVVEAHAKGKMDEHIVWSRIHTHAT